MDVLSLVGLGFGIILFGFFNGIGSATAQWYFANHLQHKLSDGLEKNQGFMKKVYKFFEVE